MIQNHFKQTNLIAFILKIMGLLIISWGILSGLMIMGEVYYDYGGRLPISSWTIVFTPILVGVLVIGFGEVIDLLQRISNQNEPEVPSSKEPDTYATIPFEAEQELHVFYEKKGLEIEEISPTKKRDIFIVKVDGKVEYIELGEFSPRLLSEEESEKIVNLENR